MTGGNYNLKGDINDIANDEFESILTKIRTMMTGDVTENAFIHSLRLEQLRLRAQSGPHKGKSVLWLLAAAAANDRPEALVAVWKLWANHITEADVQVIAEEGSGKGKSVQRLLAVAAFREPKIVALIPRIGYWALIEAASTGELELVNRLLTYPEVEENFETLLHALEKASTNEHSNVVDRLLEVANRAPE